MAIMVGKVWLREHVAAGHMVSPVRQHREMNSVAHLSLPSISAFWGYGWWDCDSQNQ